MRLLPSSMGLLLAAAVGAQQAVIRSYDLRPLTAPLPGLVGTFEEPHLVLPVGPVLGSLHNQNFFSDSGRVHTEPVAAPWMTPNQVVERLGVLWTNERGVGDRIDNQLSLRAPSTVHTEVQDLLSVLVAIRQQTRRITLLELPADAAADPQTVLTAEQIDALLASVTPSRATTTTVGLDMPWLWANGRSVRYVRDFDVEVAEKASISDPKLGVFFAGSRLGACLTPMIDGRCLVRLAWQTAAQVGTLAPRELPGNGLGTVQLPVVSVLEVASSAAVPPGGGVLFTGDRGARSWLLRIEAADSPPLQFGAARALPLGSLAVLPMSKASSREIDFVTHPGEDHRSSRDRREVPDAIGALDRLIDGRLGDDGERAQMFGSHIVLRGGQEVRAPVEAELQRQARMVEPASLTFRVGAVRKGLALGHLVGSTSADELAAALSTEARLATLPGHAFGVTRGREVAFVADYEVEIASKAEAANPVVQTAFDGFRISGMLHREPGRAPALALRLQWGEVPAFVPLDFANPALGAVDNPVSIWTDVEQRITLRGDGWHAAHVQPDPAAPDERSLVLMVRAK